MDKNSGDQKDQILLRQLKDILLSEDRADIKALQDTLESYDLLSAHVSPIVKDHLQNFRNNYPEEFRKIVAHLIEERAKRTEESIGLINALIDDKAQLSEKVSPIVVDHIENLKQNFPKEFTIVIDKQIETKLKESQDEILNIITPVLGKLIRKSIAHQFQMLKENIDRKIKSTFSKQGFFGRLFKSQRKNSEEILSEMDPVIIEEVYVIQRDSGLLIGSASKEKTLDQDMIAGMFTAIKAFVEDAFKRKNEELEMIEYDHYRIFIQNFYSYYIAVAMSGSISASEKGQIANRLYDFAESELKQIPADINDSLNSRISEKLKNYFFDTEQVLKSA